MPLFPETGLTEWHLGSDNDAVAEIVSVRLVLWTVPLFCLGVVAHLCVWRSFRVKRQLLWLFALTGALPLCLLWLLGEANGQPFESLLIPSFFSLLLMANYFAVYPALQAASPTVQILSLLYPGKSISKSRLLSLFEGNIVADRVQDLESSGLLKFENEKVSLTPKAFWLCRFFSVYRKCLGLSMGEG